jgi:TetR/AcrR family transcriptional regulator, copper-responsive repressor
MKNMGRPKGFNRETVLQKALVIFWKKGFADTTVQDLEKKTGVNKSGLYSEFSGKDDLFVESLKYYISSSDSVERLSKIPLGWGNIESYLLSALEPKPELGCFVVSSLRELHILPKKSFHAVSGHVERLRELIKNNLEAEGYNNNAETLLQLILTFNAGICLQVNLSTEGIEKQIHDFLKIIKMQ